MLVKTILVSMTTVVAMGGHRLAAQEFGLTYTTEWQTDFQKGTNWVNLLRCDISQPISKQVRFDFASISVAGTCEKRLANDLQTFSNIEEENIPFALALLGLDWQIGESSLFFGIRNLNEDYFTSPCTSLFTNSSCGIFPTLSANYPIANYPMASVGVHYKLHLRNWRFETSVYNGRAGRRFTGKENVFRFCPGSDGMLSVSSINFQNHGSSYYMGIALHSGMPVGNENRDEEQTLSPKKKVLNKMAWGYAEQRLSAHLYALMQYSMNPSVKDGCRSYVGAGLLFHFRKTTAGLFANYADFTTQHEWASELTWKIPCLNKGYIQPTLHWIKNSSEHKLIGVLRFGYGI